MHQKSSISKKNTIDIPYDFDFGLVGIVSPLRDYILCWEINRILKLKLSRLEDIEISNALKGKHVMYSFFRYENNIDKCIYHLVSNKYFSDYLVPELKEFDYFLRFSGDLPEEFNSNIQGQIKSINHVMATVKLNPTNIKSRHNLILD